GKETTFFPANVTRLALAKPIYETVPGWSEDLTEVTDFQDLPVNAQNYVRRIEELIGKPITFVGVGPKRSQTIIKK
ncbi:adenylosuccinate synthetase, partial [Planctomycetota bacterium]